MSNSIAPGSSADVNVRVTALTTNPNVPVQYKTKILHKNLVNGVNTLTQEMMSAQNTKYVIKYDYVLGEDITVPENCILEFDGGNISGEHNIIGNKTGLTAAPIQIFGNDVSISGTWSAQDFLCEWFNDNIEKCINSFGSISLIKETKVYTPIHITKFASIVIKCEKGIIVDSSFEGEYLFTADCETVPVEEGFPNPILAFAGPGIIDLNNRTCFLKANTMQYSALLQLSNITVINAINPNYRVSDISEGRNVAILYTDIIAMINCCTFATNIRQYNFSPATPNYGVHFGKTDNMVSNTWVIIGGWGSIGFHNCIGNSRFDSVHVWGSPTIGFEADFSCTFNNCYSDWCRVAYFFKFDDYHKRTISITNHHFIGPSNSEDEGYYLIKVPWPDPSIKGIVTHSSIGSSNNYNLLGYGDIDGETTTWFSTSIDFKGLLPNNDDINFIQRGIRNHISITIPAGKIMHVFSNYYSDGGFYTRFKYTGNRDAEYITLKNNKVYIESYFFNTKYPYGNNGFNVFYLGSDVYFNNNSNEDIVLYWDMQCQSQLGNNLVFYTKIVEELPSGIVWMNPIFPYVGSTTLRPALSSNDVGHCYYDKTLNKPLWWTGTQWVDATGTAV